MVYRWLLRPTSLILAPLLILIMIGVACGDGDATPVVIERIVEVEVPKEVVVEKQVVVEVEKEVVVEVEKEVVVEVEVEVEKEVVVEVEKEVVVEVEKIATAIPVPTPTPAPAFFVEGAVYGPVAQFQESQNPDSFDPHGGNHRPDNGASSPMYNQLIQYDPLNPTELIGDLAKSWKVSDDGLTYTFDLVQGVKWHDGTPFTVEDAVFSVERLILEGASRPRAGVIRKFIDSAEKIDDDTLAVHLQRAAPSFPRFFAVDYMKMVSKDHVEAGADLGNIDDAMGTGPFMGVSFTPGASWEYERNPNYFEDGRPFFDGMKVFNITDKGAILAAFKTGQVLGSITADTALDVDDLVKLDIDPVFRDKLDVWWVRGGSNEHFLLNVEHPPFDDPLVRRAFHLALDRQEINLAFGFGKWELGAVFTSANPYALTQEELVEIPGYRQLDGEKHPEDIAEAQRLMAEAGFPGGEGFEADLFCPVILYLGDACALVKEQMKNFLGVDLEFRGVDIGTWIDGAVASDFNMAILGYSPMVFEPDDRYAQIYMVSDRNWSRYEDPEANKLYEAQQLETDPEARKEIIKEMQRVVLNGAPGHIEYVSRPIPWVMSTRIRTERGRFVPPNGLEIALKHSHEWLVPEE